LTAPVFVSTSIPPHLGGSVGGNQKKLGVNENALSRSMSAGSAAALARVPFAGTLSSTMNNKGRSEGDVSPFRT
jgi:hypothetical protein